MHKDVRVAVCGPLPTACDFLLRQGVEQIDKYMDATELIKESSYHLILVYAPHAEGLMNIAYFAGQEQPTVPIRLLSEPCCQSALLELRSVLRRITQTLNPTDRCPAVS